MGCVGWAAAEFSRAMMITNGSWTMMHGTQFSFLRHADGISNVAFSFFFVCFLFLITYDVITMQKDKKREKREGRREGMSVNEQKGRDDKVRKGNIY